MVAEVPRSEFPDDIDPQIGQVLELTDADGDAFPVTVAVVSDTNVTLDANHPLAGKDLTFEIELVSIAE
jgi:peptidylprolyl isomerase